MRAWVIASAAAGLAAVAWASAEPSRHDGYGLEITFPAKWIVGSGDPPLLLLSRSTDNVSFANCVATGEQIAGTRALTQTQLNEGLAVPLGEEFWRQVYGSAGLVAEIKSQASRAHMSGVTIQEAYFDLSKQGGAPESKMSVQQAIFVRPGYTVTVACSARALAYQGQKTAMTAVIDSVRFFPPSASVAGNDPVTIVVKTGTFSSQDAAKASSSAARAGQSLLELSQ